LRAQGILTDWNDERGFGFIVPDGGGTRLFVHVSDFPRGRRPAVRDLVTYDEGRDDRNRPRAAKVRQVMPPHTTGRRNRRLPAALAGATFFFGAVGVLMLLDAVPALVPTAYAVISVVSLSLYRADKAAAQRGAWRVPESTLHLVDVLGGWPGGLVGRHAFRHKTRKQPFRAIFWGTVITNCLVLAWFMYDAPAWLR
jgi:uncharacterized membrane protein YsdA (DUF1294 family)/cold shock CspA family protein